MLHAAVVTRAATTADVPVLAELCAELRTIGGRAERAMTPTTVSDVGARLAELVDDSAANIVLASIEGRPAGLAIMRVVSPDPLSDSRLVQLSHLLVRNGFRHCGVGHALIEATSDFAVEHHVDQIAASVFPSLREASRFYARLGFAPAATHRVAPVAMLRRRLGADPATPSEAVRRRTRLLRPVPPQRPRGRLRESADR